MSDKHPIIDLLQTIARLRDPDDGCPWALAQDYTSLAPYTLEEAYEVIDAIDRGDMNDLRDELGDLLLQPVLLAHIASQQGYFDFNDVITVINEKLIRRHPHIFADKTADTPEEVVKLRHEVKKEEKGAKNIENDSFKSVLEGVPLALPSLLRIYELDERAAKQGFDFKDALHALSRIEEELAEVKEAIAENASKEEIEMEISDVLTATAVLARKLDINPERALQKGCTKFTRRFQYVEEQAFKTGKPLNDYTTDKMIAWWREAKKLEKDAA